MSIAATLSPLIGAVRGLGKIFTRGQNPNAPLDLPGAYLPFSGRGRMSGGASGGMDSGVLAAQQQNAAQPSRHFTPPK